MAPAIGLPSSPVILPLRVPADALCAISPPSARLAAAQSAFMVRPYAACAYRGGDTSQFDRSRHVLRGTLIDFRPYEFSTVLKDQMSSRDGSLSAAGSPSNQCKPVKSVDEINSADDTDFH